MQAVDNINEQQRAQERFEELGDYKDSIQKAEECKNRINELVKREKKNNVIAAVSISALVAIIAFVIVYNAVLVPMRNYKNAIALFDSGNYDEAATAFEALGDYKDAVEQIDRCHNEKRYKKAEVYLNDGKYREAINLFELLGDYSDSVERFKECYYCLACSELEAKTYFNALDHFKAADSYKDAKDKLEETEQIIYDLGTKALEEKKYVDAIKWFEAISGYKDADEMIKKCNDIETKEVIDLFKNKKYSESFEKYKTTSFYKNNISFEKFMNDNGLAKELKPFIDELNKYEGNYGYFYSDYSVSINRREMTITLNGSYTKETWSYNWEIGESTYKSRSDDKEFMFDKNKETLTVHWRSGLFSDSIYLKSE